MSNPNVMPLPEDVTFCEACGEPLDDSGGCHDTSCPLGPEPLECQCPGGEGPCSCPACVYGDLED